MSQKVSRQVPFVDLSFQHKPIQAKIIEAIEKVTLKGDFILGQALKDFEAAFAACCDVQYAVGVASGTDAITLGLQACGIVEGDEILIPANTFIATVMGVLATGAKPVLVDCCPKTALIDLEKAAKAVTSKTRAIIPVHLYGQMVSPSQLRDFNESHNLIIFEDAAQAHGASSEGEKAGSVGLAAAFSFYPSKNLGAFGNGGILLTKEAEIAAQVRTLRNYGAPKKYFHTEIGKNSRLDTIQAAVLQIKLPFLEEWNLKRNKAAQYYDHLLKDLPFVQVMENQSRLGHVYHLYVLRLLPNFPGNQKTVQIKLESAGIQSGIHYPIPCHLQPGYQFLGYKLKDFPQTEMLAEQIISLPMYPGITESQIEYVVENLTKIAGDKKNADHFI